MKISSFHAPNFLKIPKIFSQFPKISHNFQNFLTVSKIFSQFPKFTHVYSTFLLKLFFFIFQKVCDTFFSVSSV